MRLALLLALGACTAPQATTFLEDVAKPVEVQCAEARAIADDLVASDPEQALQWRALAATVCVR